MTVQSPNLRPLNAGEILDRAFRLYRANFPFFVGIAGVLLVPFLILELLSLFIFQETRIVSLIQSFFTTNLLYGAIAWATSRAYLGLPVSINASYQAAQPRFWSFFKANISLGLVIIPAAILFVVGAWGGVPGLIATGVIAIPYIFFWSIRWGLNVPTIMIENLDTRDGLTRSWSLTSQDFKHAGVVWVAAYILSYLVVTLPNVIIVYAMTQFDFVRVIGPVLSSVMTQMGTLISVPLNIIILVILYYDLRVRREAYDLELALEATEEKSDILNEQDLPDSE